MLQEVDVLTFSLSASFQISYIKSNFHSFFCHIGHIVFQLNFVIKKMNLNSSSYYVEQWFPTPTKGAR